MYYNAQTDFYRSILQYLADHDWAELQRRYFICHHLLDRSAACLRQSCLAERENAVLSVFSKQHVVLLVDNYDF